jgi:hypothetical protein
LLNSKHIDRSADIAKTIANCSGVDIEIAQINHNNHILITDIEIAELSKKS